MPEAVSTAATTSAPTPASTVTAGAETATAAATPATVEAVTETHGNQKSSGSTPYEDFRATFTELVQQVIAQNRKGYT